MRSSRPSWPMQAFAILAVVVLGACTSNPKPQVAALRGAQGIETFLAASQDAEQALCGQTATNPTHCPNAQAGALGLTDAKHQQFNVALASAFRAQVTLAKVMQTWTAGQPAPADAQALVTQVTNAVQLVQSLNPAPATAALLDQLMAALRAAQDILTAVKGVPK